MLRKYKIGFDIWGMILLFVIMIPNFIWFAIPSPNDILRTDSITPHIDTVAAICQVLMIISLCIFVQKEHKEAKITGWIGIIIVWYILYWISWVCYYLGITNIPVILGLTISPCLVFLFFALYRKNMIAVIPITVFAICHLTYAIINFMI